MSNLLYTSLARLTLCTFDATTALAQSKESNAATGKLFCVK